MSKVLPLKISNLVKCSKKARGQIWTRPTKFVVWIFFICRLVSVLFDSNQTRIAVRCNFQFCECWREHIQLKMSTPTCHGGGKTGNRRRRPSSKCSAHRSSPRTKPILPPPQEATRFVQSISWFIRKFNPILGIVQQPFSWEKNKNLVKSIKLILTCASYVLFSK